VEETRGRQEDGNKEQNQEDSLGTKDGERYLKEWIVIVLPASQEDDGDDHDADQDGPGHAQQEQ